MKKTIRMNERELRGMVSESVKRVLNEAIRTKYDWLCEYIDGLFEKHIEEYEEEYWRVKEQNIKDIEQAGNEWDERYENGQESETWAEHCWRNSNGIDAWMELNLPNYNFYVIEPVRSEVEELQKKYHLSFDLWKYYNSRGK